MQSKIVETETAQIVSFTTRFRKCRYAIMATSWDVHHDLKACSGHHELVIVVGGQKLG